MSYLDYLFLEKIKKDSVKVIFELGSRDLLDAVKLSNYYNCKVYAFECNPDCLSVCNETLSQLPSSVKENIYLSTDAISLENGDITFFPFDLTEYDNMGSSSMFKIDFSLRNTSDPDFNRKNPQKTIILKGKRLDTFMNENNITNIDLLCIDLQGYELNALKSLGSYLQNVKYIITECSIKSTYVGGANFSELNEYLTNHNFQYICSNKFKESFPNLNLRGFTEFDALFINKSNTN